MRLFVLSVKKRGNKVMDIVGLLLIVIGGGFNTYQKIRFGMVNDYWNFLGLGIYNNLNDWMIGVGLLLYIIGVWKKKKLK